MARGGVWRHSRIVGNPKLMVGPLRLRPDKFAVNRTAGAALESKRRPPIISSAWMLSFWAANVAVLVGPSNKKPDEASHCVSGHHSYLSISMMSESCATDSEY